VVVPVYQVLPAPQMQIAAILTRVFVPSAI
jgi:hypothetical protein